MTDKVTWSSLVECYRHCEFREKSEGLLAVANDSILNTLRLLEDDDNARAADFYATQDIKCVVVGDRVPVRAGKPALYLGILAVNLQALVSAPDGYLEFPKNFYLIEDRISDHDPLSTALESYRTVVSLAKILQETAVFTDRSAQRLFYFKDEKLEVSVKYSASTLKAADVIGIARILDQFKADGVHRTQKLAILSNIVVEMVKAQPSPERFEFILKNVDHVLGKLEEGYRLFVSSFSYDKIRSDLENAQVEFTTKIHKTFVDVQGQLLGIPIATVVVASQLKSVSSCGIELLTNFAVVAGAWIFVLFLWASIINQWLTLDAIESEVNRQKIRLTTDFAAISSRFLDVFNSLISRICWYRFVYCLIGLLGLVGSAFATFAYLKFTTASIWACILS